MKNVGLITAGGRGVRLGFAQPKQFLELLGAPMIVHTLRAFERAKLIDTIVVTLPLDEVASFEQIYIQPFGIKKFFKAVAGGETRQASVKNGLEALEHCQYVAIHDAARCLITPETIDAAIDECAASEQIDGVIVAEPVRDSLKKVDGVRIQHTVAREGLWAMQTPQIFRHTFILDAYRKADEKNLQATDDAQVAELSNGRVHVFKCPHENMKITFPQDLAVAEVLLRQRS